MEYPAGYWTKIITPHRSWFNINLRELWQYRDLVRMFVLRDFVAQYKQTILGPLWHIIQPLFTTIVFTLVFGRIAGLSTDGKPAMLFFMSGIVIWQYFAECLSKTSGTFIDNSSMFGKVYFPRLTVPVATVISGLITFGVQLSLFGSFFLYFYLTGMIRPVFDGSLLLLPLLVLQMAVLGLGLGIIVSSLTIRYRDLRFAVGFGVQLAMYASPVIYSLANMRNETAKFWLGLNPVAPVIEAFRYIVLGSGSLNLAMMGYSLGITIVIFLCGVALFHRVEKTFMDTV